jgi:GNAT superfamily N-acetyltransferase
VLLRMRFLERLLQRGVCLLRNCGKVWQIEDVVVDSSSRGKQLGNKEINFLIDHARSIGCYKVILNCSVENRIFYEKCGFKQKEVQMGMYFVWITVWRCRTLIRVIALVHAVPILFD